MRCQLACLLALAFAVVSARPAVALDDEHWRIANGSIDKGIAYLRTTQNEDGSWMPEPGPAITSLIVTGMLDQPDIDANDPTVAKALTYIMSKQFEDGSFRENEDGILSNYNTAITLSALARIDNDPKIAEAIRKGQQFLIANQWQVGMVDSDGNEVTEDHPYYGGFGYGRKGRADLSNTHMTLQALHDTGVPCDDPAFQRALVFLNKLQAYEGNETYGDQIDNDGGFIYAPSINRDHINTPESKASQDQIDAGNRGETVSGLRTYGGMTYAGFKSLLYAELDRDDARVQAVLGWIANNYRLDVNPGMPEDRQLQGLFYYYMTMSRALDAWGSSMVTVNEGEGQVQRDWANDLIDALANAQNEDGSWANIAPRWLEDKPALSTAYAIIALNAAID
ncbi:MAG: prenyltransferase/squalene oxidase repeat-containing protein [Planctomycetota bacterium]